MGVFFQGTLAVLAAAIAGIILDKQGKEFKLLLSLGACSMVLLLSASFLEPVLSFLRELKALGQLDGTLTGILFQVLGISLISEIAGLLCSDAGNSSLGKTIQLLSSAAILWLSIPLFQALLSLIQEIMGML